MEAFVAPRHSLHGEVSHSTRTRPAAILPRCLSGQPSATSFKGRLVAASSVAAVVVAGRRTSSNPSSGRTRRGAAEDLDKAVAEGRMITVEESTLRKAAGGFFLVLFLWQAFLVLSTGAATLDIEGSSYATLALLASNSLGFAGSGFLNL
eukprot:s468_g33.t1